MSINIHRSYVYNSREEEQGNSGPILKEFTI